jgi:hypothetical protein
VSGLERVADRTVAAGVPRAGKREIFGVRLADDGPAGIQDSGYDGGIDISRISVKHPRAIGERHARDARHVLQADLLASENTLGRTLDIATPQPGIEGIVLGLGLPARVALVFNWKFGLNHTVKLTVGSEIRVDYLAIDFRILRQKLDAEVIRNRNQRFRRRVTWANGHDGLS